MGVEIDAPQIDHPRELSGVPDHDLLRGAAGREGELDDLDPVGPGCGSPLLEEEFSLRPVHEPLEGHWPARDPAHRAVGDGQVVPD
jgi:hypothetical protein